jgi:hypothetical protein
MQKINYIIQVIIFKKLMRNIKYMKKQKYSDFEERIIIKKNLFINLQYYKK